MELAYELGKTNLLHLRPMVYYDYGCERFGDTARDAKVQAEFDAFCSLLSEKNIKTEAVSYAEIAVKLGNLQLTDVMTADERRVAETRFPGMTDAMLNERLLLTKIGSTLKDRAFTQARIFMKRFITQMEEEGITFEYAPGLIAATSADCPMPHRAQEREEVASMLDSE